MEVTNRRYTIKIPLHEKIAVTIFNAFNREFLWCIGCVVDPEYSYRLLYPGRTRICLCNDFYRYGLSVVFGRTDTEAFFKVPGVFETEQNGDIGVEVGLLRVSPNNYLITERNVLPSLKTLALGAVSPDTRFPIPFQHVTEYSIRYLENVPFQLLPVKWDPSVSERYSMGCNGSCVSGDTNSDDSA